ncbi:hypothetical protein SSU93_05790 [Enterococcus avium]|uniref:hypothetical protein n=1 Tax=Enterococcus avium TaxID=33945 RepID=UPI002A915D12|nr:hypothetical protein [Enterococcus avium]MDY6439401.1 hypothetical protein [Enterococcus avium]MDY6446261.1 hypothetical protein [Enterococcus avium]MDY6452769.1 hypothetical protein [Enterococcus avium]MDY6471800.1 hypothetical protein [Enterococcus avium]
MGKASILKKKAVFLFIVNLVMLLIVWGLRIYGIKPPNVSNYLVCLVYFIILMLELEFSNMLIFFKEQSFSTPNFLSNLISTINIGIFLMTLLLLCNRLFNNSFIGILDSKVWLLNISLFLVSILLVIKKQIINLKDKKKVLFIFIGMGLFIFQLTVLDVFSILVIFFTTSIIDRFNLNANYRTITLYLLVIPMITLLVVALKSQNIVVWFIVGMLMIVSITIRKLGGAIYG